MGLGKTLQTIVLLANEHYRAQQAMEDPNMK